MTDKEYLILKELTRNEDYSRKVKPFLKKEYFTEKSNKIIYNMVDSFIEKYNELPSKDSILVVLDDIENINEDTYTETRKTFLKIFKDDMEKNQEWLLDSTEQFCKDSSLNNALSQAIEIQMGENNRLMPEAIPDMLREALGVSFDTSIGHNYFDDAEERFEWYHTKADKIPFELDILNKMTGGGVERKTLNCIGAETNGGKSMWLTYLSSSYIRQGFNVLYITLEMAEEKVAQRIDANLLNTPIHEVSEQLKPSFIKQIKNLKEKVQGKLVIKEYPTSTASVNHFRVLLNELKLKQKFVPDIIVVDYLSIAASSRIKDSSNLYSYVKSIAEELRGLASEQNVCIWTATQFNRNGYGGDPEITDTAQSQGLPETLDFYLASIRTEEMIEEKKILLKQLKSRYGDKGELRKVYVGEDFSRSNVYEIDSSSIDFEDDKSSEPTVTKFQSKKKGDFSKFKM